MGAKLPHAYMANWLESSFQENYLGVLVSKQLNAVNQQCTLVARKANCILSCISKSRAITLGNHYFPLWSVLEGTERRASLIYEVHSDRRRCSEPNLQQITFYDAVFNLSFTKEISLERLQNNFSVLCPKKLVTHTNLNRDKITTQLPNFKNVKATN